jgi:5-methylcytosine-specific restriction protein A
LPDGTQHVVCGGVPLGFGAPVYAKADYPSLVEQVDRLQGAWPDPPLDLRTTPQLRAQGRRPANLLRPDGYLIGSPRRITFDDVCGPETWTVHRSSPLYAAPRAVPAGAAPDREQGRIDRRSASAWADEVLADPSTVILSVGTIGDLPWEADNPREALATCEIAAADRTGQLLWHQVVDPGWDDVPTACLTPVALSTARCAQAPRFEAIRRRLENLLEGKRVVVYGRNRAYAALWRDFEHANAGVHFPDGFLGPAYPYAVVDILRRFRWECAQLRYAEFRAQWDQAAEHYALPPGPAQGREAPERCRAVAELLREMAAPVRYQELNNQAVHATEEGRSHRPRAVRGTRLSRSEAARQAVLERSGGSCESPDCPNPHFTRDRTAAGNYLLQVDHIDDHAQGGADVPEAMVALCPNCHTIKTYGTTGETLRERLREAARDRHHYFLNGL